MSAGAPLVVKLGGSTAHAMPDAWWDDLAAHAADRPLILVHGWSKPLRQLRPQYALPSAVLRDRYGNQSRWTTPEVIADIKTVSRTLAGQVGALLDGRGIGHTHVFGSDGLVAAGAGERWWWQGKQLVELDNLVGPITTVTPGAVTPPRPGHCHVVTPLALDPAGREVNTDADRAAAAVAGAFGSPALVLVTDVDHLLIDGRPVARIGAGAAADFRDRGATGGMRKKLRAAGEALDRGVDKVVIGSAPVSELLAERVGTVLTRSGRKEQVSWRHLEFS
ncbi:acetylglutamate kinase [Actinoplanes cyaneus]|uniref:acetylglutamate kinase n=1 Tax=Actinoplanes cyaneus TaxID=52696 RepID=A0A919IIB3_9ACTN|nr:hypothetical protein [Actinoplanes cyaneus]MCW2137832.1 acetylglutamate kinase/acetylglutamate/LysW-gamma-L-alpha-aminoadipate kinase [Actinoplanes cyaneus]GID64961.1 acetylglutamate kinase [Actinoplanes cyaneus]